MVCANTRLNPLNRVSWLKIEGVEITHASLEEMCLNPLNRVSWLKMNLQYNYNRAFLGVSIPLIGSVG